MRKVRRERSSALRPIKRTWLRGIDVSLTGQDWLSALSAAMPASGHDDAEWDCTRGQLSVARTSTLLAVRGWAAVRASMTVPAHSTQVRGRRFGQSKLIRRIVDRVSNFASFLLASPGCGCAALACPRCGCEASRENVQRGRAWGCSHLNCEQCGKTSDIAGWRLQGLSEQGSGPLIG